ncbi:MAG TPA: hypothetical protein VFV09_09450 [Actinomycetota bacterium]|nr:hypothetical protein [Actinomycetota bacterium]
MSPSGLAAVIGNSTLWRGLSPRNSSHLTIFGCCAVTFAAVLAIQVIDGREPAAAVAVAANAAVMLFLSWAIARELDPDFPRSAFVAAAVAALILAGGSEAAGASVGVLMALRIAGRSTGKQPSLLDLVAAPVLAAAFAWLPRGWIGGVAVAVALVWDTLLPEPGPRRNHVGAALTLAATVAVTLFRDTLGTGFVTGGWLGWAVVAAALAAFPAIGHYVPRSRCDRTRQTIEPERLKAARLLALGTGLAAFVVFGTEAAPLLAGLWAAVIGIAIYGRLAPTR